MQIFLIGKKDQFTIENDLDRLNQGLWKEYPDSNNAIYWDGDFQHIATAHREYAKLLKKRDNIKIEEVTWKPNMKK